MFTESFNLISFEILFPKFPKKKKPKRLSRHLQSTWGLGVNKGWKILREKFQDKLKRQGRFRFLVNWFKWKFHLKLFNRGTMKEVMKCGNKAGSHARSFSINPQYSHSTTLRQNT